MDLSSKDERALAFATSVVDPSTLINEACSIMPIYVLQKTIKPQQLVD